MTSTEGVALQVDDVYVPLGLVERKKPPKRKDQDDISPEQGSELYKETEITKTYEHDTFLEEVLKQQNTRKSKGKRIAIIGEPGAGKTTLLQQIANWVWCEIQQSIVIWVSLADLQGQKLEEYLLKTWLTAAVRKKGKAKPTQQQEHDFVALFKQNHVWLVLDGLDEMSASSGNPLTEIARQFRDSGLISQARIVLTCRVNLWDGGINALDDFDIYRTLNFSYPEQVEKFIHKWFVANPEAGKQLCTALKEPGKERIQDLVKNPLRLTLMCFNWQSGDGKLPETQAGIYQRFVDDFYKWKQDEFPTKSHQEQQLSIKLGELAKTAIDKETSRFRLRQDLVNSVFNQEEDEMLLKLALNRGWLNCIGVEEQKVYAFFHASFQEYFAAKAIDDWHFFLNHIPKNPSQGTYRIFESQWKQTILLWLGREEEHLKQQKQQFIDALVNFKDGCKQFYEYRAYFLAAAGIVEFKNYSQADEIVKQIVKWSIDRESSIQKKAESALQQTDRTKAIAALVELLQLTNVDDDTRWRVARSLETIGTGNQDVIAALVELLQLTNVDDDTRWRAALSLGTIDPGNKIVIATLVQLLQSNHLHDFICWQVAYSLGQINPGDEIAITTLVQLLQSTNVDEITRSLAASSLGLIGTGNKIASTTLVQLLQSTNVDDFTHSLAASSLGRLDPGNEIVIATLVQLLQSNNLDVFTRWHAASNLGKIVTDNEIAISALVQLPQSTTVDDFARSLLAGSTLGTIDLGNEIAIPTLVQLLQSTHVNDFIRIRAAEDLGKINPGNKIAISALVQLLQSTHVDDYIRREAAESLCKISIGNEFGIAALIELLQSITVDEFTHSLAVYSLEGILQDNQHSFEVVKTLSCDWQLHDEYYDLACKCSQNMPYPDFYQAWHQHNFATRTMRSLKKILFTRII